MQQYTYSIPCVPDTCRRSDEQGYKIGMEYRVPELDRVRNNSNWLKAEFHWNLMGTLQATCLYALCMKDGKLCTLLFVPLLSLVN